jgi:tripartite-type tricarboxylate transporter receptor subunit TctC
MVKTTYALMMTSALAGMIAAAATPAAAADEDFYKGKTLTMIIGTGPSPGAVGSYPRTLQRVLAKHLPGAPTIVVSNMPGAGGIKASNYLYSIAPQDGTYWGFITRGFVLAPLLKMQSAEFDPTKFQWIGSPARSVSVGEVWSAATPVRTIQEAMKQEVIVGATSPGQDTGVFPAMLNRFVGTKFKIVPGYKSSGDVDLAMEKKEVHGKIGVTWTSLNSGRTVNYVKDGTVTIIVQLGLKPDPDVPATVPVAIDLAQNELDRQAIQVICSPTEMGYPSFMGPGVPAARVAMIRKAYNDSLKDPEFIALAQKQSLDITPISGEELDKLVKQLYALPPAAVARAREVLPESGAD